MLPFAKRIWVVLVILLVVVVAVFVVDRFRGFFGQTVLTKPGAGLVNDPKPFNPKVVKYQIFGTGTVATNNYLDLDARPQKALDASLPLELTLQTTAPAASPNIIAQSDGGTIGCRITVAGVVKDERTSDGVNAQTFCLAKSA